MQTAKMDEDTREVILSRPDVILDDKEVMSALIEANEKSMGGNIVDLRGIAMERLERRLDRLEDTHRSVIAAAYENLAGTNQVHRAVMRLLDPVDFNVFLDSLSTDVAEILRVDVVKLVLESTQDADDGIKQMDHVLGVQYPGFVESFVGEGRPGPVRQVTLRQVQSGDPTIYGDKAPWIRSEACLTLDFGENTLPGVLVLGAEDPHQFTPQQGTDLLGFFAGVFERAMRRWLA